MIRIRILLPRAIAALLALSAIGATACDSITGGPKKIIFNETICANQAVIRMDVGTTYRLVLDNDTLSPNQNGMTVRMDRVPLVIKGAVPPNSTIGDPFSDVVFQAQPNEETTVDVVPTRSGAYQISCGAIIGQRAQVYDLTLQIIPGG